MLHYCSQGLAFGIIWESGFFRGQAVNLYFFLFLEVVEEEEFLGVEEEELASSLGEGPTVADVHGDAAHIEFDEGRVAKALVEDVHAANGSHRKGLGKYDSQHRNIVEDEVFDDIHAADANQVEDALKIVEAEVVTAADGLGELQAGKETFLHKLTEFQCRRVENECGVHHKNEALAFGESAELLRLLCRLGGRFGDHDVLAVLEGLPNEVKMRLRRSHDGDAVDVGSLPQLREVRESLEVPLGESLADALRVFIERENPGKGRAFTEIPQDFAPPPSKAEDGDIDVVLNGHFFHQEDGRLRGGCLSAPPYR